MIDTELEEILENRKMNSKQEEIKRQLMQLGNNVALARTSFANLTDEQCEALQYCINNIKIKLNQFKRNHFRL